MPDGRKQQQARDSRETPRGEDFREMGKNSTLCRRARKCLSRVARNYVTTRTLPIRVSHGNASGSSIVYRSVTRFPKRRPALLLFISRRQLRWRSRLARRGLYCPRLQNKNEEKGRTEASRNGPPSRQNARRPSWKLETWQWRYRAGGGATRGEGVRVAKQGVTSSLAGKY